MVDILPYYKILSLERDDKGTNQFDKDYKIQKVLGPDKNEYEYKHVFINPISISSTFVRGLIRDKKQVYPLLPIEVADLIKENNLYM